MKKKVFEQLLELIQSDVSDIYAYFSIHNILFERKAQRLKTGSYGGYEITKMVGEFNQSVNDKSSELLEKINNIFKDSGRNPSEEQYEILANKCTKVFTTIIDNYTTVFQQEFELNRTIETSLTLLKGNASSKINCHIKALKILTNTKLDKALLWTKISAIFAGISLLLSVIAIVVTILFS